MATREPLGGAVLGAIHITLRARNLLSHHSRWALGRKVESLGNLVLGLGVGACIEQHLLSRFGVRGSGFGFRVSDFGLKVSGFGFQIGGFGVKVPDFGFSLQDSGFKVLGVRSRSTCSRVSVLY